MTTVQFQALEWSDSNDPVSDTPDLSDRYYNVHVFGVMLSGEKVTLTITDYLPSFYIKVPDHHGHAEMLRLFESKFGTRKCKIQDTYAPLNAFLVRKHCQVVKRYDGFGFKNGKQQTFFKLAFNHAEAMRKTRYYLQELDMPVFDASLDPILKFIHSANLKTCGFIEARGCYKNNVSRTTHDFKTTFDQVIPIDHTETIAPIVQASYDIEVYSHDNSFPNPAHKDNAVTHIATHFKRYGDSSFFLKHVIVLGKCEPLADKEVVLECYDTEAEVLTAWARLLIKMDPDIIFHYNGDGFDGKYLYTRALMILDRDNPFFFCGKIKTERVVLSQKKFSSSAYGSTDFFRLLIPGRTNFDVLTFLKREKKEDSYKLDDIAKKYLNKNKDPITPKDIFEAFRTRDSEKNKWVTGYCVTDAVLPQLLVDKFDVIPITIEMANVTYVPIKYLLERGQQIKVMSQMTRLAYDMGFLFPTFKSTFGEDSDELKDRYEGALVLDPVKGVHYRPVATLDFASLYPSIMMAHNLCYSSVVMDPAYDNAPGIEYLSVVFDVDVPIACQECPERAEVALPPSSSSSTTKLLPTHCKKHKPSKEAVAIETPKTTTTVRFAQNVPSIIPRLLSELSKSRKHAKMAMEETSDPFKKSVLNGRQLALKVSMNSVYGFCGSYMLPWKDIAASVTAIGREMLRKTRDYVLQAYPGSECIYGDSVMPYTPVLVRIDGRIEVRAICDLAQHFVPYPQFKPHEKHLKNKEQALLPPSVEVWTHRGFASIRRVIRHRCKKRIYRVITNQGVVDVTEDHSLVTDEKTLVAPKDVLPSQTRLLHALPDDETLFCKDIPDEGVFESADAVETQKMYLTLRSLNYGVTLGIGQDHVFRLKWAFAGDVLHATNDNTVTSCRTIIDHYEGDVYDLETESGVFQAGVGILIVKNTDSVFIAFEHAKDLSILEKNAESFRLGQEAAQRVTKALFKPPIKLEFEKIYMPLLMLEKKRYIGNLYSKTPEKPDYLDSKGVSIKRRDTCLFLRNTYTGVVKLIMDEGGVEKAVAYLKSCLQNLVDGNVDISELTLSKSLKDSYKQENVPHKVLAEKIEARNPGGGPKSNDRVPFVYITSDIKRPKQYEIVEDPEYVLEHNLKLNTDYYIEHQLITPICQLLSVVLERPESLFAPYLTPKAPKAIKAPAPKLPTVKPPTVKPPSVKAPTAPKKTASATTPATPGKALCQGVTTKKKPCSKEAGPTGFCFIHAKQT